MNALTPHALRLAQCGVGGRAGTATAAAFDGLSVIGADKRTRCVMPHPAVSADVMLKAVHELGEKCFYHSRVSSFPISYDQRVSVTRLPMLTNTASEGPV